MSVKDYRFRPGVSVKHEAVCPKCGGDWIHFEVVPEDWDGEMGLTGRVKCFKCEHQPPPEFNEKLAASWEEAILVMQSYWTRYAAGVVLPPMEKLSAFASFVEGLYGPLSDFRDYHCESRK